MIQALILRFGAARVFGAAAVLLAVLAFSGALGWAKIKAWWYERQVDRVTVQRDVARAERDVARKDATQTDRAATITAETVEAQDTRAADTRAATIETVEVIRERIREVPVTVPAADDPVVREHVAQARARAQAAQDRLRGTPGD